MSRTRREFLGDMALGGLGLLGVATVPAFIWLEHDRDERVRKASEAYYGRYVEKVDEIKYFDSILPIYDISDQPHQRRVRIIPIPGRSSTEKLIHVGLEPKLNALQFINSGLLNTEYVVPVFGQPYSAAIGSGRNVEGHVNVRSGNEIQVGIWLMLADQNGNPVSPKGETIDLTTQRPFYTPDGYDFL